MPFVFHWPQLVYIGLLAASLGMNLAMHGRPREGNFNLFVSLASVAFASWLLYEGGFWTGGVVP